uniref:Uncharacterized protein n=1 Tax=Pavo cristatus TaxID=9049 RepID=A0A8C9G532_PAVCR
MELLVNVRQWIEENKAAFLPPVCNKLIETRYAGAIRTGRIYHVKMRGKTEEECRNC